MLSTLSVSSLLLHLISAQRVQRFPTPRPTNFLDPRPEPVWGAFGQDCTPPPSASAGSSLVCADAGAEIESDVNGIISCGADFDCCRCGALMCGPRCESVQCRGDSSCFGVRDIGVYGGTSLGATVLCEGERACESTSVRGRNIGAIQCRGGRSCAHSAFDVACQRPGGCTLECFGDDACAADAPDPAQPHLPRSAVFRVENSFGLSCAHRSCENGAFLFESNVGGAVVCAGQRACRGAQITINDVDGVFCTGADGCRDAEILVLNPRNGFVVECSGENGCANLKLEIVVDDARVTALGAIRCASTDSCRGLSASVFKDIPRTALSVAALECVGAGSCRDAMFDVGFNVRFERCACNDAVNGACANLLGVTGCLAGLSKLECVSEGACRGMHERVVSPAKDFQVVCGSRHSCSEMTLDVEVDSVAQTQFLKGVVWGSASACSGLTLNVNNSDTQRLDAGTIDCSPASACAAAKFSLQNAELEMIKCGVESGAGASCGDCTVTTDGVERVCEVLNV